MLYMLSSRNSAFSMMCDRGPVTMRLLEPPAIALSNAIRMMTGTAVVASLTKMKQQSCWSRPHQHTRTRAKIGSRK